MSIKEKETEKKNELIKQTNSNLKEQLKIISKQIEAAIENKKNNSTFHSQKQIQYDIQKTSNFNYKINVYKKNRKIKKRFKFQKKIPKFTKRRKRPQKLPNQTKPPSRRT
jgi:Tfp pilus assembly ATPase PilU